YTRCRIDHHFIVGCPYKGVSVDQVDALAILFIVVRIAIIHPFADEGEEVGGHGPTDAVRVYDRTAVQHGFPAIVRICITISEIGSISGTIREALAYDARILIMIAGDVETDTIIQETDIRAEFKRLSVGGEYRRAYYLVGVPGAGLVRIRRRLVKDLGELVAGPIVGGTPEIAISCGG